MSSADVDPVVVVRPLNTTPSNDSVSPLLSTPLTGSHLSEAVAHSPDNGVTLDLAHKGLTDVGEAAAQALASVGRKGASPDECPVLRLALGHNCLTSLPMAFARLSRLRYLNLRSNNFTVFPDVLTMMPSLEILDISRNKLKRLPSKPGSLTNLRVFSFSRNKVSRLPLYLSQFRHLSILQADRNPLEWPPRSVMESPNNLDDPQIMKDWIRGLQKWMEEDGTGHDRHKLNEDSFTLELDHHINDWSRLPVTAADFDAGITPHARSFSMDSNFSTYSFDSPNELSDFSLSMSSLPDVPVPRLTIPPSHNVSRSPSPDSFPRSTVSTTESVTPAEDTSQALKAKFHQQHHGRNASFTASARPQRPPLFGKKSLPDLRTVRFNFPLKNAPELPERGPLNPKGRTTLKTGYDYPIPYPHSPGSQNNHAPVRPLRPYAPSPLSARMPPPSMDVERNSYFRRLSTFSSPNASNHIPQSLLCLIDAARSVLFAVCQVYQTLQHYTIYVIDDRLSSVLKKVLDPASADMMQFISTLDRFDTISRKTLPPPIVCRAVVESCKDTVAVFGKAVGVLNLQLRVLATQDDVRYLRQMLLVLYGATAEISYAWQAMVPYVETVRSLLRDKRPPPAKQYPLSSPPAGSANGSLSQDQDSFSSAGTSFLLSEAPSIPSLARSAPVRGGPPSIARVRTARRQAGSFSLRDVEIGASLPSVEEPLPMSGVHSSVATHNMTLRVGRRTFGSSGSLVTLPTPVSAAPSFLPPNSSFSSSGGLSARSSHSRQGSQTSLTPSSSASSPSVPAKLPTPLETPPNSRKLVDKEALDAMRVAVEAAPSVWEMLEDLLGDVIESQPDVRECLVRAKIVTHRLREKIRAVQHGDAADRKSMREDAHVFVKSVVQLSNVIKNHGAVSSTLRSKMVKLTNSTEEFVILLHVSSFSPQSANRPYSPMLLGSSTSSGGGMLAPIAAPPEDIKLASSLSRSQSTQAPTALKKIVMSTPVRDGPRSALPGHSLNVHG